jgi:8-oxo-dGTP diphosphatase
MSTYMKDMFCNYCAHPLDLFSKYPKNCPGCNNTIYKNPIPVVITIVADLIGKNQELAILVIKRKNEPQKDCWAFPGGYLECNETWQEGSARELFEETGIVISPNDLGVQDIATASNGNLIIFSFCWVDNLDISKFVPNEEVSELKLITKLEELAFPTHTEILKRYF